ncbi:MAG: hypothetical protein KDC79_10430 [Cyclobacteriaceae bacterium]|nr:hypothetical protein [Cyclobacteriaceae bacterium]
MKNIDKIAAYFDNELTEAEKQNFLSELESNPELKNEFDFQQHVVDGIKAVRKAELKAMLNSVPVASVGTSSTSVISKMIIGGAAAVIIGSGIYWYYFTSNTPSESIQEPVTIEYTQKDVPVTIEEDNQQAILEEQEPENTVSSETDIIERKEMPAEKPASKPTASIPVMPDTEESFSSQALPEESLEVPKTVSNASVNLNSKIDVEVKMKKKYDFHYQFDAGKLVLYGDFDDSLFEVLELNDQDESKLYLYYKSNYYFLNDKSGEIAELKPVKDAALTQKLETLR